MCYFLHDFWWEICQTEKVSFLSLLLRFFSLYLVLRGLIIMCLGLDFFGFYCLVFIELLESVGIYLLPYLGHFQPFLQLLSPALIFPSLCDSYNMNFRFFIISYVSETFSLQSIFLSAFKLNYFCCLSSNSLNCSSVHSILLLSSSTDFF